MKRKQSKNDDLKLAALTYAPLSDKQIDHLSEFEEEFNCDKNEMNVLLLALQNNAKYLNSFRGN